MKIVLQFISISVLVRTCMLTLLVEDVFKSEMLKGEFSECLSHPRRKKGWGKKLIPEYGGASMNYPGTTVNADAINEIHFHMTHGFGWSILTR